MQEIKHAVDLVRSQYNKKRAALVDKLRQKFMDEGGEAEDFKTPMEVLALDRKFKDLLDAYHEKKEKYDQEQEKIRQHNYQQKLEILEKVRNLTTSKKDFDEVFKEFRQLERKWREIGQVPADVYRELMHQWNQARKEFYDWVKISEELRQLEFQRNYDQKRTWS